jgi:hypothetical protein
VPDQTNTNTASPVTANAQAYANHATNVEEPHEAKSEVVISEEIEVASGADDALDYDDAGPLRAGDRKKRHVRIFCFSCNRYEGHSVASRSRFFYSFLIGLTFGLYYYLGRYMCHCCGSVRLGRFDWVNPRFWMRSLRLGGSPKRKPKKRRAKKI